MLVVPVTAGGELQSRPNETVATVSQRLEDFDATRAGNALAAFVDDLSNW